MKKGICVVVSVGVLGILIPFVLSAMTTAEFQKYIKQINAKAGVRTTLQMRSVKPLSYNGACPVLSANLRYGMRGADVSALQTFLISQHMLPNDSATGYFGALTERAAQLYQQLYLIVTKGTALTTGFGAVGPQTRAHIAQCGSSKVVAARPLIATASTSSEFSPAQQTVDVTSSANSSITLSVPALVIAPVPPQTSYASTLNALPAQTPVAEVPLPPEGDSETELPLGYKICASIPSSAIVPEQGFAYVKTNFFTGGNTTADPENSKVVMYENGLLMGPGNALLPEIRDIGEGHFSHWSDGQSNSLYFSSTDNENPLTNGRTYAYGVSEGNCP